MFSTKEILLNICENKTINTTVVMVKQYIYVQRCMKKLQTIMAAMTHIMYFVNIERVIAKKKKQNR